MSGFYVTSPILLLLGLRSTKSNFKNSEKNTVLSKVKNVCAVLPSVTQRISWAKKIWGVEERVDDALNRTIIPSWSHSTIISQVRRYSWTGGRVAESKIEKLNIYGCTLKLSSKLQMCSLLRCRVRHGVVPNCAPHVKLAVIFPHSTNRILGFVVAVPVVDAKALKYYEKTH